MALKLEVGKYYKRRDGSKVGPLRVMDTHLNGPKHYCLDDGCGAWWREDGYSRLYGLADLIEEWVDTPIPVYTGTDFAISAFTLDDLRQKPSLAAELFGMFIASEAQNDVDKINAMLKAVERVAMRSVK